MLKRKKRKENSKRACSEREREREIEAGKCIATVREETRGNREVLQLCVGAA